MSIDDGIGIMLIKIISREEMEKMYPDKTRTLYGEEMNLYTTSEYIKALKTNADGNTIQCQKKEFAFFSNQGAAEHDAQWLVDYYKKQGKKVSKPTVYKVKFLKVTKGKKS